MSVAVLPSFGERAIVEARAAGYIPIGPTPQNKDENWALLCSACRVIEQRSLSLIRRGYGCRTCKGKGAAAAERLIRQKGFIPCHEPYPGARAVWIVWCTACRQKVPIWYDNVRRGIGCGGCKGYHSDPAALVSEMLARGLRPDVVYPGRINVGWPSTCLAKGHKVAPRLGNLRRRTGSGCAYCAGNALDVNDAVAVMDAAGWIPLEDFPGRTEHWICRCRRCDSISTPTYNAAKRLDGCRFCDKQGFDYVGPGFVYALRNDHLCAVKLGITSLRAQRQRSRLQLLGRDGWETKYLLQFEVGADARRVEQAVLRLLTADLKLQPALTNAQMRHHGARETFREADITAAQLWGLAKATADEQKVVYELVTAC